MRSRNNTLAAGPGITALFVVLPLALGACASRPGELFPPLSEPVFWPQPPDPARIHYVGELGTDQDLKPGRSVLAAVGRALFGKAPARSMLTPYAVAGDGRDRVFVCDSNAQLVHVFDLKTRRYQQWRPAALASFSQPVGIAYEAPSERDAGDGGNGGRGGSGGGGGRLLVADPVQGGIYAFDDGGQGLGWIGLGLLTRPTGVAADPARGRILVTDAGSHELVALDPAGRVLERIGDRGAGPGQFNFPTNLAMDPAGNIYVSDSLNARIQVFDTQFRHTGQIGRRGNRPGYFSQPKGLTVDGHGHLYVVDAHFEAVQIFDTAGNLLLTFGREGRGPGEFWLPAGVFAGPDGRVRVADTYNRRIQVFQYRPPEEPVTGAPEPGGDPGPESADQSLQPPAHDAGEVSP